ncbi:MAG: 3,4-dehydroadipyl-CoA semialdehyde dehydrogenase [Planctomycetota bacterium]
MKKLENYLQDRWISGEGSQATLLDPATGEALAETSTAGLDFAAALKHSRELGGRALRAMTFAERGKLLMAMSRAIHAEREALIDVSMKNGGNTRGDAKFDIDGGTGTLAVYAKLGEKLGDTRHWLDGEAEDMGASSRMQGRHLRVPRRGLAIHLNAFNFPAWGMLEKVACAFLAGVPVISKPSTNTCLLAHRIVEVLVDSKVLPDGAFGLVCGSAGDLLDHVGFQDCIAFTGSARTGNIIRTHPAVLRSGARVNVEADSLNAAVLGPDVEVDTDTFDLFLRDVTTEIRQKAGQKCTAIRRVLVPKEKMAAVKEKLAEQLQGTVVGVPGADKVRMGPLSGPRQLEDARANLARLREVAEVVYGDPDASDFVGDEEGKGAFMPILVLEAADARKAAAVHEVECFGPVTTLMPYDGSADDGAAIVALGEGSLVTTFYSDDRKFAAEFIEACASYQGRLVWGSERVAAAAPTPGVVLPNFLHGGPGRAGGGEELGGLRGLEFYSQRVAVQGFGPLLDRFFGVKK